MRKYALIMALLVAGGCKSAEGPEPLVTTSVQVASTPTQIAVGETAQASVVVKDQNGGELSGRAVAWSSLNQSVATVTPAGLIRGVAPGNATIVGTVDGITGSATITVVAPTLSCLTGPTTVDLAPGTVRVVSSSSSNGCIKISSTSASSSYLVIAANLDPQPDVFATFALKSDEGETVPNTDLLSNPFRVSSQISVSPADVPGALQTQFESKLRKTERRELDFRAGKREYQARLATPGIRKSISATVPNVGDKSSFKVPAKFDGAGNYQGGGCSLFTQVTATARFVSTRAIIYVDDAAPAGGFTDTDFQEIATEFDNLIYPTDTDYFGTPLDQDGNSRVIILYTPLVNKLTPANQQGFVGGFFFVGDLFTSTQCAQSNQAELFYVLAPDPSGTINNNVRTTQSVRQGTRGTIAHEFQHMINGSERFKSQVTEDFESVWLDEALSHFAEDLNGRVLRGLSETGNYTDAQLRANFNDYAAFFFQNLARFRQYLANTPYYSPTSAGADTSLAVRGAAWALVRYTADQYAPNNDIKSFTRALVPGPDTGVVNLTRRGGNVPYETLISGWLVANHADDLGVPNLDPKFTYKTYNMRDAARGASSSPNPIYPLNPILVSGSGFITTGVRVRSASGAYFSFFRGANDPARSFRFLNNDLSTAASFPGASLIILRTQ